MRFYSSRVWLVVAAFVVVADFGSSAWICQAEEALPDKPAVISAVREYVSSIQSIHVRFNFWQKGVINGRRMNVSPETEVGPLSIEWAEQGLQKLLRTEVQSAGARGMPTVFDSYDGQAAYQVTYEPADATRIRHVRRLPEHRIDFLQALPGEMCGLRVPTLKGTLVDVLSRDSTKIISEEEIFSTRCLHVSVPDAGTPGESQQVAIDVWLDLDHEFLPRRFVAMIVNNSPGVAPQNRKYEARCEAPELMSVRDELLNRTRWFPRVIASTSKFATIRATIDSAVFNRSLPKSLFQPPMPEGTLIIDGEDKPFVSRKTSIVGGSNAATALVDQRLRDAAKLPSPLATRANASNGYVDANATHVWNWGFVVSGICVLVLAIVCVRHLWFRT